MVFVDASLIPVLQTILAMIWLGIRFTRFARIAMLTFSLPWRATNWRVGAGGRAKGNEPEQEHCCCYEAHPLNHLILLSALAGQGFSGTAPTLEAVP